MFLINMTNYFSYLFGIFARIKVPGYFVRLVIRSYIRIFKIDLSDFEADLGHYKSLSDFFTRRLKQARPIQGEFVSPVDGSLRESAEIINQELKIKTMLLSLSKLIGSKSLSGNFYQGQVFNFYLAPKDYHHIHSPCDAIITKVIYIPGKLWPVNDFSISRKPDLFAENRRVTLLLETQHGKVALVLVGAFNVGCIELDCLDSKQFKKDRVELDLNVSIKAGEHLGYFNLGSSVVVLVDSKLKEHYQFKKLETSIPICYGVAL